MTWILAVPVDTGFVKRTFRVRSTAGGFTNFNFNTASVLVTHVAVGTNTNHAPPWDSIKDLALSKWTTRSQCGTRILALLVDTRHATRAIFISLACDIHSVAKNQWVPFKSFFTFAFGTMVRCVARIFRWTMIMTWLHARILAVFVNTCSVVGTFVVMLAFSFTAFNSRIASPSKRAVADGNMVFSAALCTTSTWIVVKADVNALVVNTGTVGWTLAIIQAFTFVANDSGIANVAWWTATNGSVL